MKPQARKYAIKCRMVIRRSGNGWEARVFDFFDIQRFKTRVPCARYVEAVAVAREARDRITAEEREKQAKFTTPNADDVGVQDRWMRQIGKARHDRADQPPTDDQSFSA